MCDQTTKIKMLTGSLSTNNATQVFSTRGHNMFVRFGTGSTFSKPGFSAKINFGNDISIKQRNYSYL